MKNPISTLIAIAFSFVPFLISCSKPAREPIAPQPGTTVVVKSLSPSAGRVPIVDTILGTGFNSNAAKNIVYFNGLQVSVLMASSTQLIVQVPSQATTGSVSVSVDGTIASGPVFTVINRQDSVMVTTYAGTGGSLLINGPANQASFRYLSDVVADGLGNLYIADGGANAIRKISASGLVTTFAGGDSTNSSSSPGPDFWQPSGVAIDANNNIYVADSYNNRIRKISPSGQITTIAGSGAASYGDGVGSAAYFNYPTGICVDKSGNLFVADNKNNCIRKVTQAGVVTTLAGSGFGGYVDSVGTNARFYNPSALTIDSVGNLYVVDGMRHIRKITPSGVVTTLAGNEVGNRQDGQGINAGLGTLAGVTIDKKGNLYVTQSGWNLLRKITPDGWVTTLVGATPLGVDNVGLIDGPGSVARFHSPGGITIDAAGNLYVCDGYNGKIRKVTFL